MAYDARERRGVTIIPRPVRVPDHLIRRTPSQMMRCTIEAAAPLVRRKRRPHGPFGASAWVPHKLRRGCTAPRRMSDVLEWRLIAIGVNSVVNNRCPTDHAEMMTVRFAGQALGGYNLWKHQVLIVTTGAPCEMCETTLRSWGQVRWLISGCTIGDTIAEMNFHEGRSSQEVAKLRRAAKRRAPGREDWVRRCRQAGVEVIPGVCRATVIRELFRRYTGPIYNGGPNDPHG